MGKSDLKSFLEASFTERVALSFRQVEILLGEALPAGASDTAEWWRGAGDDNLVAAAWTEAGFEPSHIDLGSRNVVFAKRNEDRNLIPGSEVPGGDPNLMYTTECRHPAYGILKGKIWIEPGYDLTQPLIDPEWLKEKYGE